MIATAKTIGFFAGHCAVAALIAACAGTYNGPEIKAEPGIISRTITHRATASIPTEWTEEVMTGRSAHDTLIDSNGTAIQGVPVVFVNGIAQ